MCPFQGSKRVNDRAILHGECGAVSVRMMKKQVTIQPQTLLARRNPQDPQSRLIDKGTPPLSVNAIDALGCGFKDQPNALFFVGQATLGVLAFTGDGAE